IHLRPVLSGWSNPPAECCGDWTPDGRYFVFRSQREVNAINLWAIRESNGWFRKRAPEPTKLTAGTSNMLGSVPSRDGRKLFAIQGIPRGELMRYDAKSQQFLPYLSGISAFALSFSKDGQWVAYASYPEGKIGRA